MKTFALILLVALRATADHAIRRDRRPDTVQTAPIRQLGASDEQHSNHSTLFFFPSPPSTLFSPSPPSPPFHPKKTETHEKQKTTDASDAQLSSHSALPFLPRAKRSALTQAGRLAESGTGTPSTGQGPPPTVQRLVSLREIPPPAAEF
jgi:hypothetical protein